MALFHFRRQLAPHLPLWSVPRPLLDEIWIEARNEAALELLGRLPHDGLAIVGTRSPQPRSVWMTHSLLEALEGSSRIIISGLARGIDRAAHEASLDFSLPTIAVLGCGHHHHYPPENETLREAIVAAGGLVISEFAPSTPPARHHFVKRNRCIAAWTRATCIIEAPAKSGALLTADYAMEHHATVFCVPVFPGDPAFAGNQRLLDENAAIPLWGAHSLGSVWIDLAARPAATPALQTHSRRLRP